MAEKIEPIMRVRELIKKHEQAGWDKSWEEKVTPWDAGHSQQPLQEVLVSGEVEFPKTGRALVPGCGRGYDVICIASSLGLDTLGIDVAPNAVKAAQEYIAGSSIPTSAKIWVEEANFFDMKLLEDERFELIYDYTFFCALPPDRRGEWGRKMSELVKRGGYLVTLVYPIDGPREGGPPYSVETSYYEEALGLEWDKVMDRLPERSLEQHEGRERIAVWKKL